MLREWNRGDLALYVRGCEIGSVGIRRARKKGTLANIPHRTKFLRHFFFGSLRGLTEARLYMAKWCLCDVGGGRVHCISRLVNTICRIINWCGWNDWDCERDKSFVRPRSSSGVWAIFWWGIHSKGIFTRPGDSRRWAEQGSKRKTRRYYLRSRSACQVSNSAIT
jgi:hypothetical protein